jgi:hypothetical protein
MGSFFLWQGLLRPTKPGGVCAVAMVTGALLWACTDNPVPIEPENQAFDASDAATTTVDGNTPDVFIASDTGLEAEAATDSSVQPTAKIIFVSAANGNDANDGLSKEKPIKSLGAALAYIDLKKLEGYELHVCRGTYPERQLQLTKPITIRGEYSCVTWERATNFGKASNFSELNASIVQLDVDAIQVRGSNVQIEALHIKRTTPGAVIDVSGGNGFKVSNSKVTAGLGNGPTTALSVEKSADVRIEKNAIHGGSGVSGDMLHGSAGLVLVDAAAVIEDNDIDAGAGRNARVGSVGIRATGTVACQSNSLRVLNNRITGSGIATGVNPTVAFIGFESSSPCSVQITDNVITTGAIAAEIAPGAPAYSRGIVMGAKGGLIARNRLVIGDIRSLPNTPILHVLAGMVLDTDDTEVINNAVLVGVPGSFYTLGLELYRNALVQHNTVIVAGDSARSVQVNSAPAMAAFVSNVYIENNLLVGRQGGLWLNECQRSPVVLRSFRNNMIRSEDYQIGFEFNGGRGCAFDGQYKVTAPFPGLNTPADNNVIGPEVLGGAPINDVASWQGKVFGGGVLAAANAVGCPVARGGRSGIGVTSDLVGVVRDQAAPSVGAWEHAAPLAATCVR